jgi:hypothetical protein
VTIKKGGFIDGSTRKGYWTQVTGKGHTQLTYKTRGEFHRLKDRKGIKNSGDRKRKYSLRSLPTRQEASFINKTSGGFRDERKGKG